MQDWIYLFRHEPEFKIKDGVLVVRNVRDHVHADDPVERYITKKYELSKLKCIWLGLEPLPVSLFSHIFFVFDFGLDKLVVSVEARRKVGQARPVLWGFLPIFPVFYACTTEKDMFGLRSVYRKRDLYLYKLSFTKAESRKLLLEVARRADEVHEGSIRFNSFYRNCTTEMLCCLDRALPGKLGPSWRRYQNTYLDYYFYSRGLIRTDISKRDLRSRHHVSPAAKSFVSGNFSDWIRNNKD